MEDLDTPRVVDGAADAILASLERYGLEWDGDVVYQSKRNSVYEAAIASLTERGMVYACGCSRADLQRSPSAQADEEVVYPGTCREGLAAGRAARSLRFRAPAEPVPFTDLIRGTFGLTTAGDFIVKRADGVYAYQLAVVADDADQGVTQVVRGGDLLSSTPRQIALQHALGLGTPQYAHLPLVVTADGRKLGKREGALPLPTLDADRVRETLRSALAVLGIAVEAALPASMLAFARERFDPAGLTACTTVVHNPTKQV